MRNTNFVFVVSIFVPPRHGQIRKFLRDSVVVLTGVHHSGQKDCKWLEEIVRRFPPEFFLKSPPEPITNRLRFLRGSLRPRILLRAQLIDCSFGYLAPV